MAEDVELAYLERGSGEAVLLVPGWTWFTLLGGRSVRSPATPMSISSGWRSRGRSVRSI